jgi:hypothetical protein
MSIDLGCEFAADEEATMRTEFLCGAHTFTLEELWTMLDCVAPSDPAQPRGP